VAFTELLQSVEDTAELLYKRIFDLVDREGRGFADPQQFVTLKGMLGTTITLEEARRAVQGVAGGAKLGFAVFLVHVSSR
jgi:hypothetical protein